MNIQSNFWDKFSANKRNKYSLLIFIFFFVLSLFAEILSNDKPIVLSIDDKLYFPIFISYTDNYKLLEKKENHCSFYCLHCLTFIPFKILLASLLLFPVFCFFMMVYAPLCK